MRTFFTVLGVMASFSFAHTATAQCAARATAQGSQVLIQASPDVQGVTFQYGYKMRSFCSHCGPNRTPDAWEHEQTYYAEDTVIFGARDGGYKTYSRLPTGGTRYVEARILDVWGPGCTW